MKKLMVTGFAALALGFVQPAFACGDGPLTTSQITRDLDTSNFT